MIRRISEMRPLKKALFALLIGFAVVSFWRGTWGVLDTYLFSANKELSAWTSLFLGLTILALTNYWTKKLA